MLENDDKKIFPWTRFEPATSRCHRFIRLFLAQQNPAVIVLSPFLACWWKDSKKIL